MTSATTAPFWDGLAAGRLLLQRCAACASYQWTPQLACVKCLAEDLPWVEVCGRGTLYTYSVVERPQSEAFAVPYVVAIVELAEGPRMLTALVGAAGNPVELDALRIGAPVRVCPQSRGDRTCPTFRLVHEERR